MYTIGHQGKPDVISCKKSLVIAFGGIVSES